MALISTFYGCNTMKPVETLILHDFGIFLSILCLGSLLRITVSVQIGQSQELVGGFTPLGKHKGICTYMYYIYMYMYERVIGDQNPSSSQVGSANHL